MQQFGLSPRHSIYFGLVFLVLIIAPAAAQDKAADWPQFRGPGGMGVSSAKGLPVKWSQKENVVWKTAMPGAGSSSPIVLGDKIYLTCYTGYNVPGKGRGDLASSSCTSSA